MESGKYYLTKEEQLQREKWDWYSMEKTAEWRGRKKVKNEIATNMKKDGVPFAAISKYTGLSVEEVSKL